MNPDDTSAQDSSVAYGGAPAAVPIHFHNGSDSPAVVQKLSSGTAILVTPAIGVGNMVVSNTGVVKLSAGTNVTLSPSNGTGTVTVSSSFSGFSTQVILNDFSNSAIPVAGTVVIWTTVTLDNNSEYNSANGQVAVKNTGVYVATWGLKIVAGSTSTSAKGQIRKNASNIAEFSVFNNANDNSTVVSGCTTVMAQMNANQNFDFFLAKPAGNGTISDDYSFNASIFRIA